MFFVVTRFEIQKSPFYLEVDEGGSSNGWDFKQIFLVFSMATLGLVGATAAFFIGRNRQVPKLA